MARRSRSSPATNARKPRRRDEEARVWISGLEAVKAKIGVKAVYDLSATPFFLRGSGYPEGTLFPWVVSDFSLIDAIESGIVKVPRVPVADDSMTGEQPTYRDLWLRIREDLPKKGRKTEAIGGEPKLPARAAGRAAQPLRQLREVLPPVGAEQPRPAPAASPPPVVHRRLQQHQRLEAGLRLHRRLGEAASATARVVQAGQLPIFRNDDGNGGWLHRPNTILVDSQQLESGEAMSDDFKKIAAREIDEFKAEYRVRFPGRDAEKLTDEDLLREVMNTVGKAGKLGEHVKCVVSVSMLTEGWDANTVTHILGVRAFGTQLLCEQVVGRALRRMSYAANAEGRFDPEYAEVYGVPFSFIPTSGATPTPSPAPCPPACARWKSRIACEITFPRLLGYRYDIAGERLTATFTPESHLALSTRDIPTETETRPSSASRDPHARRPEAPPPQRGRLPAGQADAGEILPRRRRQRQALALPATAGDRQALAGRVRHAQGQHLPATAAADRAGARRRRPHLQGHRRRQHGGRPRVRPPAHPAPLRHDRLHALRGFRHHPAGLRHRADKCHISHVVADTDSWEQKMAQALEDMPEVVRYVKNHNLGFTIPYTLNGEEHQYIPDFIAVLDDGARAGRPAEPDRRGDRRSEEGQGRQGRHRAHAVGAGGQQPRRLRPLGLHGDQRSVGCGEHDPGIVASS